MRAASDLTLQAPQSRDGGRPFAQPPLRCSPTTHPQPPFPVYPHVYPPTSPNPETQHPCGFPADLPEQVQNIE